MATEPTQEQLSAYVDGELDAPARAELDAHLLTCTTCRSRLEGLQEVVTAIRALPMETPPRTFTVPAQRRQARSWAPIGWATSAAAAVLLIVVGLANFHGAGGATSSSKTAINAGAGQRMFAPPVQPQPGTERHDSAGYAAASKQALTGQQRTVTVPGQPGRNLTLSTDGRSYAMNGTLTIRVAMQGLSSTEASTIRIFLSGDGYDVRLAPPAGPQTDPLAFDATYAIADMHLPRPGSYSLQVTVGLADGSSLADYLPVAITP